MSMLGAITHRKYWVLERLAQLSAIFTIDICAYAVVSSHHHLVVHVDHGRARQLTDEEVVERWTQMFSAPPLIERWRNAHASEAEREVAELIIARWRERLYDVSWFMKCLNEHLARRANGEDNCTGKFWEDASSHKRCSMKLSNNTLLFALYRMGYRGRMTGHGFRGVASTILHERGWPHRIAARPSGAQCRQRGLLTMRCTWSRVPG